MFSLAGSEAVHLFYFGYGFVTFRGVQVEYLDPKVSAIRVVGC